MTSVCEFLMELPAMDTINFISYVTSGTLIVGGHVTHVSRRPPPTSGFYGGFRQKNGEVKVMLIKVRSRICWGRIFPKEVKLCWVTSHFS